MNRRRTVLGSVLILALAEGLAGCQDPMIGMIKAGPAAREQLQRANSDRVQPAQSKKVGRHPDYNDRSPGFREVEAKP
jgi:hypothetical protein